MRIDGQAIMNTARITRRGIPRFRQKIGVVFPNQDDRGTHVNVSGGALA